LGLKEPVLLFFFKNHFNKHQPMAEDAPKIWCFQTFGAQKNKILWKFASTLGSTLGNSASISLLPFKERFALGLPLSKAHSIKDETILEDPGIQKWPVR